ncbi:hypothetical protein FHS94_001435 [Sphingomonas aerophila]|jgi:hypothetical protein|uniref:Uncharacterized protein n=1 Tax=Sphingomonas aerophila TaxID=1344948 RepID=A0A7W9BCR1_9SPHN|nr:hypothetical protein [Sphingomonas aerophila]
MSRLFPFRSDRGTRPYDCRRCPDVMPADMDLQCASVIKREVAASASYDARAFRRTRVAGFEVMLGSVRSSPERSKVPI